MKASIKILCSGEIYNLGLLSALKGENIKIIKDKKDLSDEDILITDRYFYNRKRIIMIYDDIYKALLGNERVRLLRDVSEEELIMAVKSAKHNKTYIDSKIAKVLVEQDQLVSTIETLNIREKELVKGILKNLTNKQMSKALFLSEKTVKNNLTDLYKKLDVKGRTELQEKIYKIKM